MMGTTYKKIPKGVFLQKGDRIECKGYEEMISIMKILTEWGMSYRQMDIMVLEMLSDFKNCQTCRYYRHDAKRDWYYKTDKISNDFCKGSVNNAACDFWEVKRDGKI